MKITGYYEALIVLVNTNPKKFPEAEGFFLEYFDRQIQRDRIEHREFNNTIWLVSR